jgi:hypothetical protein
MRTSNTKKSPALSPSRRKEQATQGQPNPARGDAAPLMFIVRDASNFNQSRKDAKAVASHVSSRYRGWRKTNRKQLALDATTQAILGPKRRKLNGDFVSAGTASRSTSLAPTDSLSDALSPGSSPVFTPTGPPTPTDITSLPPVEPDIPISAAEEKVDDEDYRQLTSRLGLLAPTAENSTGATDYAWRLFEDFVSPQPNLVGYHSLDPFSSFGPEMDLEMKSNLHFYFKVIQPFAVHLIDSWAWLESISQAQSSKVLAYAVASFASLFLSGCLRGGPGVVLPPPAEQGQTCLWPIPPWLRLQTICLSELNSILQTSGNIDTACYQAMLFLFRISVLLADGPSARIHAKAMKRIGSIVGMEKVKLNTELSVAKVNIISAFLHNECAVILSHRPDHTNKQLAYVVELDRTLWKSDKVWHAHRGMMAGRVLTWREGEPADSLLARTESALLRIDPNIESLGQDALKEMQRCSQIALFFHVQLNSISFNPSMLRIRRNLEALNRKLRAIDLQHAASVCPITLFNILVAAAVASRGYVERVQYVRTMSRLFPKKLFMDDVMEDVSYFIDPYTLIIRLIEEVWAEVLDTRSGANEKCRSHVLWRKDLPWHKDKGRPLTRSPNLSKPRPRFEQWNEPDEVEPEFETGVE